MWMIREDLIDVSIAEDEPAATRTVHPGIILRIVPVAARTAEKRCPAAQSRRTSTGRTPEDKIIEIDLNVEDPMTTSNQTVEHELDCAGDCRNPYSGPNLTTGLFGRFPFSHCTCRLPDRSWRASGWWSGGLGRAAVHAEGTAAACESIVRFVLILSGQGGIFSTERINLVKARKIPVSVREAFDARTPAYVTSE